MHQQSRLKTFTAMYCDLILFSSFIRARDFFASGKLTESRAVLVWMGMALLVYLFNRLFLAKERTIPAAVIANVIVGIPEMFLLFRLFAPFHNLWSRMFLFVGIVFVHARIVNRFFERISIDSCIRFLEMSVFGFLIFKAYQNFSGISGGIDMLIFSAIIVSLAGIIAGRLEGAGNTEAGVGHKGLVIVGGILAAASALCVLFATFFSDAAGNVIARTVSLVLGVLKMIGGGILRVLNWILSLAPQSEIGPVDMPEPQSLNIPGEMEMVQTNDAIFRVLGIAGAVILVLLVIVILVKLRHTKVGTVQIAPAKNARSLSKLSLLEYVKKFFVGLKKSVWRRWRQYQLRNTVPGLAVYIGGLVKKGELVKEDSETYSHYLHRLADAMELLVGDGPNGSLEIVAENTPQRGRDAEAFAEKKSQLADDLRRLAEEFDRQYFAGEQEKIYTHKEASELRKLAKECVGEFR